MFGMILAVIVALVTWLALRVWSKQRYWQSMGVVVPPFIPVLGHIYEMVLGGHRWKTDFKYYQMYKKQKMWGMYEVGSPVLYIADPEIIKAVLVKDADHFVDRRSFNTNKSGVKSDLIMEEMLLNQKGENWKKLRNAMTPTFSSGKIKAMFPYICDDAQKLVTYLETVNGKQNFVRMDIAILKCMLSVIASCAFGLSLPIEEQTTEFERNANKLSNFSEKAFVRLMLLQMLPAKVCKLLRIRFTEPEMDFFCHVVTQTLAQRKNTAVRRNDFVDLLQDVFQSEDNEWRNSGECSTMVAQCVLFLFAGFDTTTISTSFATYLLAKNQRVQDKLRDELTALYETDANFTYDNISSCSYLEATFNESLRLYGLGFILERQCTRDYKVPGTDVQIRKGNIVAIPNWSLCHDPDVWDEPEEFKPERFLNETKTNFHPMMHIPFGVGPRSCIAMRFAQLEAKVVLAYLVLNHRLTLVPGKEELVFNKGAVNFRASEHGIHVCYEKIIQ